MELLIGGPVLHRAWILPHWFDYVEQACQRAGLDPSYVFVGDPVSDEATWAIIDERAPDAIRVAVDETKTDDTRDWSDRARYHRMVELRNLLLGAVRAVAPTWFLSLDSDILLHPDAVSVLLDSPSRFDAVGGKCHMGPGVNLPSYAMLGYNGSLERQDSQSVGEVDVIMAIKLMRARAYAVVDYIWHPQGEDVGWSIAARQAGVVLGWNGQVCCKHVMDPSMLAVVDNRVGF